MERILKIGISDCGKFENYRRWIEAEGRVEVVKLSFHLQNEADTESCDGVLFSGGEDLHPALYGKPEYIRDFLLKEIIPARDLFEYRVLVNALEGGKPVLGICRGLQLINVYLGGTLVPDIPSILHSYVHGKVDGVDQMHTLYTEPGSLLASICGQKEGWVNTAHHQSVDQVAPNLRITARSEPDIVEALEWEDRLRKSWLLMVQWHPERMPDGGSPFSSLIKKAFLDAARSAKNLG